MKANPEHYFESKRHRSEFVRELVRGEVSSKFTYAGSSARTHDEFARTAGYEVVTRAVASEVDVLAPLAIEGELDLVDVGPGNGDHTAALLVAMQNAGVDVVRLLLCDFASDLMRIAADRIRRVSPETCIEQVVWDFESEATADPFTTRKASALVFLLLGNTLGNVRRPVDVLGYITRSAPRASFLLVGVRLISSADSEQAILGPYQTDVFLRAVAEPFLAVGCPRNVLDVSVSYQTAAVEARVRFRRGCKLADGTVVRAGHEVVCFRSQRFTLAEVDEMVALAGGRVAKADVDETGRYTALVAIEPASWGRVARSPSRQPSA